MTSVQYPSARLRGRHFAVACVAVLVLVTSACTSEAPDSATNASLEATNTTTVVETETTTPETAAPEITTAAPTTTTTEVEEPHLLDTIDADFEGALLGVSTGLSRAERGPRFLQLEADAGRQLDIGHVFHSWDTAIPTVDDLMHLEDGRTLMISWNGTDTREISSGLHDDWIRSQATAVRDLEDPVLLRWLWEMDGNRRRDWVYSGADYVAAWMQVRSVFDEVGADNAQFVWCPNEFLFWDDSTENPDDWYPGDENVDWLCADGYNWPTSETSPEWITIDAIFEDFVEWAAPRNLPIVLGETGSAEAEPGAKADWLRSVPELLRDELPEVDAVVYFDKDFREFGHNDWRVDTSQETYEAWVELANHPYFNN